MATFANTFQPAGARAHGPSLRQTLALWSEMQERRRHRRQIMRELSDHTDRQLADMGLSRDDIRSVANGSYRRGG
jgi:uncharacterized protein YjiS (DUF1127 family)